MPRTGETMAKKILIFKGTVKKLSANNFHLNKDNTLSSQERQEIITEEGLFYEFFHSYINIEHKVKLPTYEEAKDFYDKTLNNNRDYLIAILSNPNISEEDKEFAKAVLSNKTSCIFADYSTIKKSHTVTKEEFKKLKKGIN